MTVLPDDAHNRRLVAHVHPTDWTPPTPAARYNLVVIGGGPAGLVAALGAAGLGAKVALVERHLLGGDCLNWGCVPSKAVLKVAHQVADARSLAPYGVEVTGQPDFPTVMERMRRIRADIGPHDSAERLQRDGVDVFLGDAKFTGPDTIDVDGTTLTFAKACIATGARAFVPPIPGVDRVDAMTNEQLFSLTTQPKRLIVVGGGVIGSEMAQAFARLGSHVELIDGADRVLSRESPAASALVGAQMERDGIVLHLGAAVDRFERDGDTKVAVLADGSRVEGDAVLIAVGRRPNLELGLDAAGIKTTKRGVEVDDHLQTTNPNVYAAGDVIGQAQFTHAADHQARIVITNALFFGRSKVSKLVIPRVTYTHPEVAAVGLSADEASKNPALTAFEVGIGETDRGRTDGETEGGCTIWADKKGRIHGASIVGEQAGELLAPVTLAMTHGLTLAQIASTIHPYPTRSEVVFKVASAFNKTRMPAFLLSLIGRLLAWRR